MARNQSKALLLIDFESTLDKAEIRRRGAEKYAAGLVSKKAISLGKKYSTLIERSYIPKVSVQWLNETIGHGLFAEETISKGSYVGEYTGIVRRNDRRYFEPQNNYCYEYPVEDEIGRPFVIDATHGCLTKFINHSPRPNLQPTYAFYDNLYHLIFIAKKEISIGEQLSYDYGKNYWYTREPPKLLSKE
jgi:SET domain-containing protein